MLFGSVQSRSWLKTNFETNQLVYSDKSPCHADNCDVGTFSKIKNSALDILIWPLCLAISPIIVPIMFYHMVKTRMKKVKQENICNKKNLLRAYGKSKLANHNKKIKKLQSEAIFQLEKKYPSVANILTIPHENGNKRDWSQFKWDLFLGADFKIDGSDLNEKDALEKLEQIRISYSIRLKQHKVLNNLNDVNYLNNIKKIALMSFVKSTFKKQRSSEVFVMVGVCNLPLGLFYLSHFSNIEKNAKELYENKNHFLSRVSKDLPQKDLVEAHNELVNNSDFLIPYFC